MRSAYRILAYILALEIVVQAAAMVYAVAGLGKWVDGGGVLDKAAFESEDLSFTGVGGFIIHGINGMMLIPLLALILFIVSFFTKLPKAIVTALVLLLLVVLQVVLGLVGHEIPFVGALHGINALLLFAGALHAARLASTPKVVVEKETAAA